MKKPPHVMEIFLQPGDCWFGDERTRIRTLLGSCVAITLWHPQRRIGGMCHFMLPSRSRPAGAAADGRYADEAMEVLLREIHQAGTAPREFEAKLFGGGRMFHHPYCDGKPCYAMQVHDRNVSAGQSLVACHGFRLKAEHLGGQGHRQVIFDIWSGHVWMKHTPLPAALRCKASVLHGRPEGTDTPSGGGERSESGRFSLSEGWA